jgi:LmbE family N-acetylglucosaminyl deacetylase
VRQVVLSPHPDDAVWSVGGRIRWWVDAGMPTTVVTVFDGDGAVGPDPWRRVAEPVTRRREDAAAVADAGAERVSLGLLDAAVRADDGVPRYGSPLRLFGPAHRLDASLPEAVAEAVAATVGPEDVVVHAPLAAGRHVDHRLVRQAATLLAAQGVQVCFYEDFPYQLRPADHAGLRPAYEPVDLPGWQHAAGLYHSQVAALFSSASAMADTLRERAVEYARETPWPYADRYWISE